MSGVDVNVLRFGPKDGSLPTSNLPNEGLMEKCLATIEDAFAGDALLGYFMTAPGAFAKQYAQNMNKGDAVWYSTADGACCLVGYEYPGARISTLQELLRGTVWLCLRSIKRMGLAPAFMAAMEKTDVAKEKHKKVLGGKFFYVQYMGTHVSVRGKGLGSKVLERLCRDADEQGMPLYLEATGEGNMRLYKRFGFQFAEESRVPNSAVPPMYCMYRLPHGSSLNGAPGAAG